VIFNSKTFAELMSGPAFDETSRPDVCDVWWVYGAFFRNLTAGIPLTVRASAPGYLPEEMAVLPTLDPEPVRALVIELQKAPNP
jgi:hypothetical protein